MTDSRTVRNFALVAPYAVWMVLMALLPQTAGTYALRGIATAALLVFSYGAIAKPRESRRACTSCAQRPTRCAREATSTTLITACLPLLAGLLVFAVWIAPESWLWPTTSPAPLSPSSPLPPTSLSPYAPAVCGWTLTLAKLCASAFVISAAEELFFRKWLIEFAGFGWMLVLFGVEHMRWDLGIGRGCVFIAEGVFAGFVYGILARRYGLKAAIIAHATTNFVLGLYVILWDKWFYW